MVRRAQAALNALGYRLGTPDGALGRKTVDALKAQQRKRGRPADAAVDEALVALLEADIADATRAAEERRIADQQRQEIERQVALRLEAERRTSEAARLAAERKAAAEEASRREAERATAERARLAVEQQQRQAAERRAAEERKAAEAERRAEEDRLAAARREPELARAETPPPPPEPAAATVASTTATPIPGRVALVIGNGAYTSVPGLPNPPNDAADVAVLERLGFRVLKGTDLERDAMVDLVEEFARAASEADVALAYFAGHGLQVRDVNYLIPVDGRVQDEFGLRRLVRLDELIEDTGRARKLALVVVDACRDNPFVAGLQRSLGATRAASVGGGLATPAVATTQTLVAYATAAKVVAADGAEGARNSPFTAALVKHLVEPEDIRIVFGRVRGSVVAATDGTQRPDIWGSLGGERIVLAPPEATAQDLEATLTPSERSAIRASLRDLGYLQSTEIGRFGYATRAAIREFQLAQGAPGTSFLNVPQMVQLHTLPGAAVLWHKHATGVQGRSSPMSKSSVLAVMVAASLVVWVAAALTGEAADRPAERGQPSPVNDPAGLQRFLNRGEPGVGRVTPTTDDWIDPVCTGYGPGLGPPHVQILVAEFAPSAAGYAAHPSGRDASGACRPPSATGSGPPG